MRLSIFFDGQVVAGREGNPIRGAFVAKVANRLYELDRFGVGVAVALAVCVDEGGSPRACSFSLSGGRAATVGGSSGSLFVSG